MWREASLAVAALLSGNWAVLSKNQLYERVTKLDNKNADVTTPVLDTLLSSNISSCAKKCYSKTNCRCLRLQNEVCRLYEYCPEPAGDLYGAVYYTESDLVEHKVACVDDLVCGFEGAICYLGQCLCQIGLSYSPSRNRCLRRCDEYSGEMTVYEGAAIGSNNRASRTDISLSDCLKACVQTTDFTCRSVDIGRGHNLRKCFLTNVVYLDVPSSQQYIGRDGWSYGHRNCK